MKQTALQQLEQSIKQDYESNGRLRPAFVFQALKAAKELEKKQIIEAYSNVDTYNDRISVFHNEELIYQTEFGEFKEINIDFLFPDEEYSQIKFVVDNEGTKNFTPGAFSATIKIKRI